MYKRQIVLGAQSVGLLVGAVAATRVHIGRPLVFGMVGMLVMPIWLTMLAFELPLIWVAAGSFAVGLVLELFFVLWTTTLQQNVPREALSRVSSYDAMGSLMFGPIGLALAGPLIAGVGSQAAFLIAAAVATVATLSALLSRSVRQLRAQPSH